MTDDSALDCEDEAITTTELTDDARLLLLLEEAPPISDEATDDAGVEDADLEDEITAREELLDLTLDDDRLDEEVTTGIMLDVHSIALRIISSIFGSEKLLSTWPMAV